MKIRVLGSCAGGGLPQWNCGCPNCVAARQAEPATPTRSQPSIGVSADGERWSILNAAPDIRTQLAAWPALHPQPDTRELPLDALLLTNADLDHVLGLLVLREAQSYRIVSTEWVRDALLGHNAAWCLLESAWQTRKLGEAIPLDAAGRLEARFFPVPGKTPRYLDGLLDYQPEGTVGIRIQELNTDRRLVYAPGLRSIDDTTQSELEAADCVFLDGTFFHNDELASIRPGAPDAVAMAHMPIAGREGSLERLAQLSARCFYIHMNNTNPILTQGSSEAEAVERAGVEIARDGLEFEL